MYSVYMCEHLTVMYTILSLSAANGTLFWFTYSNDTVCPRCVLNISFRMLARNVHCSGLSHALASRESKENTEVGESSCRRDLHQAQRRERER